MSGETSKTVDRQLGAFANVDNTDHADFIERLDEMHGLDSFKQYKLETFRLMRIAPGMAVADVGCGTGEDARGLSRFVGETGQVTGFDLSEAMIASATTRHAGVAGLGFQQAPGDKLGIADNSLDAIRADRVLIHVPDPSATIDEMIRVTRPGGRIVISEPDMPGFWVASDDHATTGVLVGAISKSCRHPYLPRDLWALFHDKGVKDLEITVRTITSNEIGAIAKVLDLQAVMMLATQAGLIAPATAEAWMQDVTTRAQTGRFVAALSIVMMSGTKS